MSQYPRRVLANMSVTNDSGRTSVFVRAGSVVDIKPGSQLEGFYGAGNLSAVIPAGNRGRVAGPARQLSKEALAN